MALRFGLERDEQVGQTVRRAVRSDMQLAHAMICRGVAGLGLQNGAVEPFCEIEVTGELQIHRDGCDGPLLARMPLRRDTAAQQPQTLSAALAPQTGAHALCLYFSRRTLDPLWVIDTVQLLSSG